ncbi:MAG: site-specific integrase, partial [Fuerstiella sp.]
NTYVGDPSLTLWAAFITEYKRVELRRKSGSHGDAVRRSIEWFERHMHPRSVSQLTSKFINDFVGKRSHDRGVKRGSKVSPATINLDLRNLKLVLTVAVEWGQLEKMPKIKMLRTPARIKRHVTAEHFAAMFAAADTMTEPDVPNATACDYWRALIAFAFVTGWRINEILNLRRDDVDFKTCQVVSRWDDSKGKRDELIFIPESVVDLLRPLWQSFQERPLNWSKSRRTLYVPFAELQGHAGIHLNCEEKHEHTDACHVYGFHDFKRSFATYNAGKLSPTQLQRLMKHSAFTTTQGYINYAKVMTERPDVFVPDVLQLKASGNDPKSG